MYVFLQESLLIAKTNAKSTVCSLQGGGETHFVLNGTKNYK